MAHKIREVYIVHHSHTDVGYTDLQEQVIYNQANNIRRAVELIADGLEKGTNQKGLKWNCETWYCVEQFLKVATEEEKKTFFDLVKKNSIGLSANYLNFNDLADCEYLISRLDIDPDIINHTPNVKFWQRWGAGFDHVDLKAWGERGIPIATCPGVNSGIVAELAIMLMLAGYRNLLQINRQLRAGHWPRTEYFGRSFMMKGKTVGVLGLGHIGKKVAALATAFGANVIYYDIVRQTEQEEKFGYRFVDFDTLLRESDIYTIHCPLNEETRGMIGAEQFAQMKPTAMLINTARGPIVDEAALIDALTTGKIATAGLDTYEREPLPKDHPLLTLDNVVASAHAGGNTKDNDINMMNYVYHNIVAFDRGEPLNTPGDIVNGEYLKK